MMLQSFCVRTQATFRDNHAYHTAISRCGISLLVEDSLTNNVGMPDFSIGSQKSEKRIQDQHTQAANWKIINLTSVTLKK
jgi:hypothetical protein